jgi:LysR family transcriptional regulator, glycine cleavage system transcriptional activator
LKRGGIPSIRGLTSFIAAAEYESFTRAAGELNLSQGAISRHIRELEGHLGIRLFARIRQRVVLTEAGRLYLSYVKKPLADLAAATRSVEAFSDGTILNLAVIPGFATRWLLPRLSTFQRINRRIMVHVTMRQRPVDFEIEPFDAAIAFDPPLWPRTSTLHLMDMDMVPACSPKLKARRAIKTPADIAKFPLLHKMSRPSRWTDWLAEAGVTVDEPPRGPAYAQMSMLAAAAIAGLGIALLPHQLFAEEFATNRLETLPSPSAAAKTSYYLIVPDRRAGSDVVQTFAAWLLAEAGSGLPAVRAISA